MGRVCGPWTRPVNTGVKNDTRVHVHTRPVNTVRDTGSVYRALVIFIDRSTIVDISTERVKLI